MVTILLLSIIFGLSCSNDADVLANAVLSDVEATERIVADDYFVIQPNESIVLDVLANDAFSEEDQVSIIEISSPIYGSVEINNDNMSITYTPQSEGEEQATEGGTQTEGDAEIEEESPTEEDTPSADDTSPEEVAQNEENPAATDTFTYTTEVVNTDETTSIAVGTVEVIINASEDDEPIADDESEENSSDDDTTEQDENPPSDNENAQSASLLFSSGFEGIKLSAPEYGYQYLSGTDKITGFTWPMRILGSDFTGIHRVNDGDGGAIDNRIENTTGPNGTQTSALFQQVNYNVQVTQTPYQINNIKENPEELYMSYWMKTDDTSVQGPNKWRAIWEYKTDDYATKRDGFRMIAFMATDYKGRPYWLFQGDTSPQDPVWQAENYDIPLILNEWFKVEYYIKWSDGPDGYASMKVNGQLIGEHSGPTTANSDDLDFIMLTQVYGNSHPMHQWVDDIEIWDGLPN